MGRRHRADAVAALRQSPTPARVTFFFTSGHDSQQQDLFDLQSPVRMSGTFVVRLATGSSFSLVSGMGKIIHGGRRILVTFWMVFSCDASSALSSGRRDRTPEGESSQEPCAGVASNRAPHSGVFETF